jgi:hypothetical protein
MTNNRPNRDYFSIAELQRHGIAGDQDAIFELGKRVLNLDIEEDDHMCEFRRELIQLKNDLFFDIPPDCPHCGGWLTDQ